MKQFSFLFLACSIAIGSFAQVDIRPSGNNPKATITEDVGTTSISIKYSRPDVNKREGKIWGTSVAPYGFSNNIPWRAGANEATTISFEHDVKIEGHPIKAGAYGLFMAVWPDSVVVILNSKTSGWGSFSYNAKFDVLRFTVKPVALDKSVESLKYEFIEHGENHCVVALQWEKLSIPFRIDVDVDNIIIATLREELAGLKGLVNQNLAIAANYCLTRNLNLEEALGWAIRAAGLKSFLTLNTLATAYTKTNKLKQADSVMNEALPFANANQYMGHGRGLIKEKRTDRALEIFTASEKRFGDVYAVNAGFMSYYSAKGDFNKALEYANKALAQASPPAKAIINDSIAKLKEGKDINQ